MFAQSISPLIIRQNVSQTLEPNVKYSNVKALLLPKEQQIMWEKVTKVKTLQKKVL